MELLSRQGMLVDGVACHDEAMAALSTTSFDLLLVDCALPDGEGLSPARPSAGRTAPAASDRADRSDATGDIVQGLDGGADDYLTKPSSRTSFSRASGFSCTVPRANRSDPFASEPFRSSSGPVASRCEAATSRCRVANT